MSNLTIFTTCFTIRYLGEAVIITKTNVSSCQLVEPKNFTPCIFEYVYFARPDSVIDGISVYRSRLEMGEHLADQIVKKCGNNMDIDVVIPVSFQEGSDCFIDKRYVFETKTFNIQVPDTSRVAALQASYKLKLPYREGFIKNRYIGPTFIMPGQQMRRKNVRRKLNAMALEFTGKSVLIVDGTHIYFLYLF